MSFIFDKIIPQLCSNNYIAMTTREVKDFKKVIKAKTRTVSKSKSSARAFLISIGIITSKGNLTKSYANLCIQPKRG